jgi:hypothetical protein
MALALLLVALTVVSARTADPVRGADPTPSTSPAPVATVFIDPLDPRAGAGANRVGAPLLAIIVVVAAGAATAALTYGYVRVTRRAAGPRR